MSTFPRMHVSLYVKDIEKTLAFYQILFNKTADKRKPGYAKFILDSPSLIISFVENEDRVQPHFGHLGFQVESEEILMDYLSRMKEQKLVVLEEMGTACCYAVQDKFWLSDPDGHQWEIYYFHADTEFNDPHYEIQDESNPCCMPPRVEKKKLKLSEISSPGECEPNSGCC